MSGGGSRREPTCISAVPLASTATAATYRHALLPSRAGCCRRRPTNSGKTFEALQALRRADSGCYAGPLRLLAWQVHDSLSAGGLPINLVTGQERRLVEGARHTACTAEMASTRSVVDVAVRRGSRRFFFFFFQASAGAAAAAAAVCAGSAPQPAHILPVSPKQVLDELQMMGDASRGWAFTRALLGLPARTLHVCGDPAVLPLLQRVVAETGGC